MLAINGNAKVFIYGRPVNLHKSFEGLCGLVHEAFDEDICSGAYFVFLNRRGTHMKVLYWDGDGLAIWYKRLEKGLFTKKAGDPRIVGRRDFLLLLEGVSPKRLNQRYSIS